MFYRKYRKREKSVKIQFRRMPDLIIAELHAHDGRLEGHIMKKFSWYPNQLRMSMPHTSTYMNENSGVPRDSFLQVFSLKYNVRRKYNLENWSKVLRSFSRFSKENYEQSSLESEVLLPTYTHRSSIFLLLFYFLLIHQLLFLKF